ncbi:unnamed protein product [Rotaria sp. Silwood2]|nr:unnamed protein product [Rotaria sp. Silwood2]CAF4216944.1 unnamed protein product [Rotaria sp. Silwood2]
MCSPFEFRLISLAFLLVFHQINCKNVTFVPWPINITIEDLPQPYASSSVSKSPQIIRVPSKPLVYIPDGFIVKLYMSGLLSQRYLIYTPTDDILVSESSANRISCLADKDHDGYPDQRLTFVDASNGLNYSFGMAFINEYFYVGNRDTVRRYSWTNGSRQITGTGQVITPYPQNGHSTRTIAISPMDDRIFVTSIQQANINGSNQTTFAYGLRNVVGLAFHPITNDLYATCQERGELGDDLVPDFFSRIEQNDFYGWSFAYMNLHLTDPRRVLSNETSERSDLILLTRTSDVLFQAHSALLDMRFYTGKQFPSRYQNGAFAAFHGS